MNIGKSVVIKGELNGSEDLTIEGHVEGKIELRDHVLTIGPNGKIKAAGVRQVRHRARRGHRQRQRDARRSTSATTDRSTATSRRRAWRLPKARTSAAASTWQQKGKARSRRRVRAEAKPQRSPTRSRRRLQQPSRPARRRHQKGGLVALGSASRATTSGSARRLRPPRSRTPARCFPPRRCASFLAA